MQCNKNDIMIKYPSDFLVRINSITGKDGVPIELDDIFIDITYMDKSGRSYQAAWDPSKTAEENRRTNTIKTEESVGGKTKEFLYVVFENYNLKGKLDWKIDTRAINEKFSDGYWNVYGNFAPTNINIVE